MIDPQLIRLVEGAVVALVRGEPLPSAHSPLEESVLEFTRALSATPPEVDSALRARLQEHFISEDFDALAAVIARANAQARSQVALEHLPASDAAPTGVPSREERSS